MALRVFRRHAYDDVTLLASTDAEADRWRLEVRASPDAGWDPVEARVTDANLNWSTPDLRCWPDLQRGDADALRRAFPEASGPARVGLPLAVMWDLSRWVYGPGRELFRFLDPAGTAHEFRFERGVPDLTFTSSSTDDEGRA